MNKHTTLSPIPAEQRVFSGASQAALWFSLGVGLLVMQVGAYLVPGLGLRDAAWAILMGSLLGAGILAWTARWGCVTGLSSAGLMQRVYGTRLASLPIVLNVVQLIGWTTFELVIMRDGTQAIAQQAWGVSLSPWMTTLLWGALLTLLMSASMLQLVRQFVSRAGLPLVILSLLWISVEFAQQAQAQGWESLWQRAGDGSMGFWSAIDLVIAMPISWLPLVADYARHGRRANGSFWGTWMGYTVANIWCYGLGVLMASVAEPGTDLLTALLLAQGGLVALALILLDELDNAYGDTYSGAVSLSAFNSQWSIKTLAMLGAVLCTGLAMVLPMHSLEPFLLTLSSVFVPLYGVMLGRLPRAESTTQGLDLAPFVLWLLGVACYHALGQWAPHWGAALPTLALTWMVARVWKNE